MKRGLRRKLAKVKPHDGRFLEVLKSVPGEKEKTITVNLTLDTEDWLCVAYGCAKSGITLDAAVSGLLRYSDQINEWLMQDYRVKKDGTPALEPERP